MDYDKPYAPQLEQCSVSVRAVSMRESVTNEVVHLEAQLADKKKLLALLEQNPQVEEIFTLMKRY